MQNLSNIPSELAKYPNWVVWREELRGDGKTTKVPYQATDSLLRASSTNPETWNRLSAATRKAFLMSGLDFKSGPGFVLQPELGLICIDLDDPSKLGPNADNAQKVHEEILNVFAGTYCEISPSGTGYHIWLRGTLPEDRLSVSLKDKVGIEIYSGARYMTMTGNQFGMVDEITYQQDMLNKLIGLMTHINGGKLPGVAIGSGDVEESNELGRRGDLTDDQVVQIAIRANSKFLEFFNATPPSDRSRFARPVAGDLDKVTSLPEQILRIMLNSPIGRCYAPDDLERKLFKYWLPESRNSNEEILKKREEGRAMQIRMAEAEMERQRRADENKPEDDEERGLRFETTFKPGFRFAPAEIERYAKTYPPGMIGVMAQEIRERATMRASMDFAMASALSLFAGLSGHAYSFEKVNGALYMLMLGTSGQGKEAPAEARDTLVNQLRNRGVPASVLAGLQGPSKITSPQGLHRRLETDRTLLAILGEATLWLNDMATQKMGTPVEIKRFILDLYGKQGAGRRLNPAEILNKDNKLNAIMSPACTLLMEGEPSRYLELVGNDAYTASGLCARIIHVLGAPDDMPPKNYNTTSFSDYVVGCLAQVLPTWWQKSLDQGAYLAAEKHGATGGSSALKKAYIQVDMTPDCLEYHRGFDRELDFFTRDNVGQVADIYNRLVPNVLRVAINVAAGVNPFNPLITREVYEWAQAFVLRGVMHMTSRIEKGSTGTGDFRVRELILEAIDAWAQLLPREREHKLLTAAQMRGADKRAILSKLKGIPWSVLQRQVAAKAGRHVGPERATQVMRTMLQNLIEGGEVMTSDGFTEAGLTFSGRLIFSATDAEEYLKGPTVTQT